MFHDVWPYLGGLGQLVEVPFTSSESVERTERYVESVTVEGRRRVQALAATPRSWSVDVQPSHGRDLSGVLAFFDGAWGPGPWHWVTVAAQQGNMLTPREAQMRDRVTRAEWSEGGPVQVSDGSWAGSSMVNAMASSAGTMFSGIPVIEGQPVTYTIDALGAGSTAPQTALRFYDASGAQVGGSNGAGVNAPGWQRVSVSQVAPAGAASCAIGVYSTAKRVARPQVTWTAEAVPYAPGAGCRAAVVDGVSSELLVVNRGGPVSSVGFTVLEVG